MATTAQDIIEAAVHRSLANDSFRGVSGDNDAMYGVLNRLLKRVYTLAALPPDQGGHASANFARTTDTVTLSAPATTPTSMALDPPAAFIHAVSDANGDPISIVSLDDVLNDVAELAPAVVIAGDKIKSVGRTGDPAAAAVLTIHYGYLPGTISSPDHYIGATTPATATTSEWPEVGNDFLVSYLALWLAYRDGTRDPDEIQAYLRELREHAVPLAAVIGTSASNLVAIHYKLAKES